MSAGITPRRLLEIAEQTTKTATDDLRRSGAAFATDALHHRMTGAPLSCCWMMRPKSWRTCCTSTPTFMS